MRFSKFLTVMTFVVTLSIAFSACGGGGSDDGGNSFKVIAGGECTVAKSDASGTYSQPGYWKDEEWTGLPTPDEESEGRVTSVLIDGNDIYAGGYYTNSAGKTAAGYWKNESWTALSDGSTDAMVNAIIIWDFGFTAGGYICNSSGIKVPGIWMDNTWSEYTPTDANLDAEITSLAESELLELYAGGYCTEYCNDYYKRSIVWDGPLGGKTFNRVDNGSTNTATIIYYSAQVHAITFFNGNFHAAGYRGEPTYIGGYWQKDGTWNALPNTYGGEARAIAVNGSSLLVGGSWRIGSTGGTITAGYYTVTGSSSTAVWTALSDSTNTAYVYSMAVDGTDIYAAGSDNFKAGYWKNSTWVALTDSNDTNFSCVYSIAVKE